jgi:predicted nucleic acid-binding protein
VKVIVDTSVWSLAFRRRRAVENASAIALHELIEDGLTVMLGCIRQEILSGIRSQEQFQTLRDRLRSFRDELLRTEEYEMAAGFFNVCRRQGIQGSNTDFLICAAAVNRGHAIFTTDRDFVRFRDAIGITLFSPR